MNTTYIDIEKLVASQNKKFENLSHPSSVDCCIYRVPHARRRLHPNDFTPQMISIGPLHYGKKKFKPMEDNKIRYLYYFLKRTRVTMGDFFAFLKEHEGEYRNYYTERIYLDSEKFVTMILTDAVFLIEFFLRIYNRVFITDGDDPLFRNSELSFLGSQMRYDLYLIENQLPLSILNDLFELAKNRHCDDIYHGISLMSIASNWFSRDLYFQVEDKDLIESHFPNAQHFIHLLILCLHPSQSRFPTLHHYQNAPGVWELHQAGVKFSSGSCNCLLDIKFSRGILEIPSLKLTTNTERLYRNLLTFEHMHDYPIKYLNDYVIIMCNFVNTPKDVDLLTLNGILMGDSEKLSTTFHSLLKDCTKGSDLQYAHVVKDLLAFRKSPWNRSKASLKQKYFNTPWSTLSVIAAVTLLVLTLIQTVCALVKH